MLDRIGSDHVLSIIAKECADGARPMGPEVSGVRPGVPVVRPVGRHARTVADTCAWVADAGPWAGVHAGQPDSDRRFGSDRNAFATRGHLPLVRTRSAGQGGGVAS